MRIVIFEGTPNEFEAVQHLLDSQVSEESATVQASEEQTMISTADADDAKPAKVIPDRDVIARILDRRAIPDGQQSLYQALYKNRDRYLTPDEAAAEMGRTRDEFHGVLGALGRRIAATPGVQVPEGWGWVTYLMHIPSQDGHWIYKLHPEVVEVLEEKGLVS